MPAGPVIKERTGDAAFGVAQKCADRGALGGATDEKVAPTRPESGIGHARHDTPSLQPPPSAPLRLIAR
jgi:hypothetical protein